jgi:hypothetical protein
MSVGLGIRRPIKEKQFKVERNKKRKLQFIIDLIIYRVYKKKRNLGISQEIDIVLKTKDFRRLGI